MNCGHVGGAKSVGNLWTNVLQDDLIIFCAGLFCSNKKDLAKLMMYLESACVK